MTTTLIHICSAACIGLAVRMILPPTSAADRLTRLLYLSEPSTMTAVPPSTADAGPHPYQQGTPDARRRAGQQAAAGDGRRSGQQGAAENGLPDWLRDHTVPRRRLDRRSVIAATAAGLVCGVLVGGIAGTMTALLVAPAVGLVLYWREDPALKETRARIAADLPFAADLMAASLLAGRPVSAATEIAAAAIGGPLGRRLTWVSGQLRLGAEPEPTWAHLARDPATGQLARAMSRAAQSGAPVADVLTRVADDAREAARAASVAAARSVGVKAVAPLGLCFLPAFVLLGIIPVVAGLAATIVLP